MDQIDGGSYYGSWSRNEKRKFKNGKLTLPQTEADCCVKLFRSGIRITKWEVHLGAFVAFEVADPYQLSPIASTQEQAATLFYWDGSPPASHTTHACCRCSTGSGMILTIETFFEFVVSWKRAKGSIGRSTINLPDRIHHYPQPQPASANSSPSRFLAVYHCQLTFNHPSIIAALMAALPPLKFPVTVKSTIRYPPSDLWWSLVFGYARSRRLPWALHNKNLLNAKPHRSRSCVDHFFRPSTSMTERRCFEVEGGVSASA